MDTGSGINRFPERLPGQPVRLAGRQADSPENTPFDRLHLLAVLILLINLALIWRLFSLQVSKGAFYEAVARDQHELWQRLTPKRGEIFIKEDNKLIGAVSNKAVVSLHAVPKKIEKPGWTAKLLADALKIDQLELEKKLSKADDPDELIKKKLTDVEVAAVKALDIEGLRFIEETGRYYPDDNLFSHVLGFVGYSGDQKVGQYGIEGHWEQSLRGKQGFLKGDKDLTGRWIATSGRESDLAQDGSSMVLTLDRAIQYHSCKQLQSAVKKLEAVGGTVIVMDPSTGAVISLCSVPDFNPNTYNQVSSGSIYNNPAIFTDYEPGSTFKVVTMAAALDTDVITPTSTYKDEGFLKFGKFTIKNSDNKSHGVTDMIGVLEKSLNTGTVHIVNKLGQENFRNYVKNFGFGEQTGIELDFENSGDVSSLEKRGEIFMATASFGQGITVTPMQLIAAYAAVANGGKLMRPYIVDEVINGEEKTKTQPQIIRQVISNRAAKLMNSMLVSVVEKGHSKKAGVPGYLIGAKTGTAQVAAASGGYSKDTIHSLVGFGPADDPKFVILVKIDKPKTAEFAESSAAPLFGEIAKFIINYWKIGPTE